VKITVLRNGTPTTLDIAPEARKADDIRFPNLTRDRERRLQLPRDFDFDLGERGFGFYSPRRFGAAISPLSDQLAKYFGVTDGVLVSEVTPGSAAEMAGLKAGDVIMMIRGQAVSSSADAVRELREAEPGTSVEIRVMRDRKEVTLTAKMPERIRAFFRRGERPI
jgi:PDZ domain